MIVIIAALLLGIVAGLRAMTAPAVLAWAAQFGWVRLDGTALAFMGWHWTPWIFTLLAMGELFTDQLPTTPSRKIPVQFATRVIVGGFCGAALGLAAGMLWEGLIAGVVGAVIGTLGGAAARAGMARAFGSDRPAAIVEDLVAIAGGLAIVCYLGHG